MRGLHLGTHPSTTPPPGGGSGSSRITFYVLDDVLYLTDPVTGYTFEAPVVFVGPTTLPSGLITAEADTLFFHYAGGTWSSPASQVEGNAPVGGSIVNDQFFVTIANVTYMMPVTATEGIPGMPPGGETSLVTIDGIEYLRIVFDTGEVRYEQVHAVPTPDATGSGGGGGTVSERFTLASATAPGATVLPLDHAVAPVTAVGYVLVDPFTLSCEIRKITGASASSLTVTQPFLKAHAALVRVLFISDDVVSFAWWNALDDGSDAEPAIQAALDDQYCCGGLYWLTGQGKSYRITKPLMLSSVGRIQSVGFIADPTFAPVDSTNAMVMGSQGFILTFTAGTDDVITTPTAHGIPGTDVKVMFKGVTGAAGLVAGRIYYSRDVVGLTFKVAATAGGAAVNITSTGSGTVYCEVGSMSRIFLRDVYINGNQASGTLAGLNGMDVVIQQPADIWKLRIDNCDGDALKLNGQDGTFYNLMLINNRRGLTLGAGCILFKFYSWNIEQCGTGVTSVAGSGLNAFFGGHVEMNSGDTYGTTTAKVFTGAPGGIKIETLVVSMNHADQTVFENTGVAESTSYYLSNIYVGGGAQITMISDADRGITKKVWSADGVASMRNFSEVFSAPPAPSSDSYPDEGRWQIIGKNGRHLKFGSVDKDQPVIDIQADTDQVGDMFVVRGTTGATVASISPAGTLSLAGSLRLGPGASDGTYSGTTLVGTAGDFIAFGDLVTLDKDDSRWEKVDISVAAAATGDARGLLGIALNASTDGNVLTVLLHGIVRADANFPALTIGAPVYASTTGDLVVTQPTTVDHVIRIVGHALTADELLFSPDNTWITHT